MFRVFELRAIVGDFEKYTVNRMIPEGFMYFHSVSWESPKGFRQTIDIT